MRFASISIGGRTAFGVVDGEGIWTAEKGAATGGLKEAIAGGALAELGKDLRRNGERHRLDEITFLPVIPDPGKILCVGVNYHAHRSETGRFETKHPVIFTRFADTQIGHLQPILCPPESSALDYEGELAVIIGMGGRRIPMDEALGHVAGYSCYNDGTVRDWQRHTSQFTPGKNFPGTGAFGPWMVTSDDVADPGRLHLQTRFNGEVVQDASTADLIFPIPALLAYVSTFTPLNPGDVIVTGTPGGVGDRRTPPLYLADGDQIEVEISGIGRLANPVAAEAAPDGWNPATA